MEKAQALFMGVHHFPNRSIYAEYVELKCSTVKNTDDSWNIS